jgi:hypothetical protein
MKLAAVVGDARPEGANRARIALEAVDAAARKLVEESKRVATVVAPDLEDQRVVTAHELVDLGLREQLLVVKNAQWTHHRRFSGRFATRKASDGSTQESHLLNRADDARQPLCPPSKVSHV